MSDGRWWTRCLVSAGTSAVLLLAGEAAARLCLRSHWDTESLREQMGRFSIKTLIERDEDPDVLYRLRRGLDTTFQESRVLTDDAGVRVGSGSVPAADQAVRIALLGDSTSFGWRVDYEASYGERLRGELEAKSKSPVVLRNYSVPGYNATQELHVFRKLVDAFRPDLVIVHHDHNDAQPTGWGYGGWVSPEYGDNALHSAFLKLVLRQWSKIGAKVADSGEGQAGSLVEGYSTEGPLYEAMMESRRALVEEARARSIPVLVVIFNANVAADERYEQNPAWIRLHKQAADRFLAMGYEVLDLYPAVQRMLREKGASDLRGMWLDAEDHHPNASGHAFIADVVLRRIEETPGLKRCFRSWD